MVDAELVRAARAGDASAFTGIFDRHSVRVHDLALAMLRDRARALEVVEATFLQVSRRLHGLADERRLAVWLLAVARRNAALRAGPRPGGDRAPSPPNDDPQQAHLTDLVWDAVAALPLPDRTMFDLSLRQGLDGQDLADAMGMPLAQVRDLRGSRRDQIDKAMVAALLAHTSDGRCPGLTRAMKGGDSPSSSDGASRRLTSHVDGCRTCTQASFALPTPSALYARVPAAPFPEAGRIVLDRIVLPPPSATSSAVPEPPVPDRDVLVLRYIRRTSPVRPVVDQPGPGLPTGPPTAVVSAPLRPRPSGHGSATSSQPGPDFQ